MRVPSAALRKGSAKGRAGSRQKGPLMAFKLLLMAQERWRRINGAHLIPVLRAGGGFTDGAQAERRSAARGQRTAGLRTGATTPF